MIKIAIAIVFIISCSPPSHHTSPPPAPGTQVTLTNQSSPTTAYISFGADSKIQADTWSSFCNVTSNLTCNFAIASSQALPNPEGIYLNMTVAFGAPVGCNATKAEVNVNNPNWYDTYDVSLVDGYSNNIEINYTAVNSDAGVVVLGPPAGKDGNENVLGVFPYGCDICVDRQNPPCGIAKGSSGCKSGSQYKPDVACQYQGGVYGGGGSIDVILVN
jgi:hypothetical protein